MTPENLLESRLEAGKKETERIRRNLNGIRNHFGWCGHCFDTYDWKKPHPINISYHGQERGMFPYCRECNRVIPNERKKELVTRLVNQWIGDDPEHIEKHLEVERLIYLAIDEGK